MRLHSQEAQGFRLSQIICLQEAGISRKQIALLTQCSASWVSKVLKRCRPEGSQNVRPKGPAPGHRAALNEQQLQELQCILQAEAKASGFETDGWTRKRIAKVIEERYQVRHHRSPISRILQKIGFTRQKPLAHDYRRQEADVERWKTTELKALKKKPKGKAIPSFTPMKPRSP